jgi:hypothetical protein
MSPEAMIDILKANGGGSFDIQTYPVGIGGLTRVNIQPRIRGGYDPTPTPCTVIAAFVGGLMATGVVAFIIAMIVMVAVAVSTDGTTNAGVSGHLISTCFFSWLIATLLGGVAAACYDLS